ncbi:hypothetical protein DL96DRAFT_941593 [Flagelloscypha sp. PMI_526]|nr:hypothetical protein DL96DRAFT_941593 [Flagelloscypha sp. PMI_526]
MTVVIPRVVLETRTHTDALGSQSARTVVVVVAILLALLLFISIWRCVSSYRRMPSLDPAAQAAARRMTRIEMATADSNMFLFGRPSPPPPAYLPPPPAYCAEPSDQHATNRPHSTNIESVNQRDPFKTPPTSPIVASFPMVLPPSPSYSLFPDSIHR